MRARARLVLAASAAVLAVSSPTFGDDSKEKQYPILRLSHFSLPDGSKGLVLDRLGDKPKVRLDDSKEVVEMFLEDIQERGQKVGTWLNGPDGKHWLRVDKDGRVKWLIGQTNDLVLDARAKPLGEPTQHGVASPPPPKTARQIYAAKLAEISVCKKFPDLKPEDSANLAKVAKAIDGAELAMFVRAADDEKLRKTIVYACGPDVIEGAGGPDTTFHAYPAKEPWAKDAGGIEKYGGMFKGISEYGSIGNAIKILELNGFDDPLPAKTPGLVWEVRQESTVIFVTLDGGRYRIDLPADGRPLEVGVDVASWPAPLHRSLVRLRTVRALAKAKAIPQKDLDDLEAVHEEWNRAAQKVWAGAKPVVAAEGRLSAAAKGRFEEAVEKECAPELKKFEQALVRFIASRDEERRKLYETAKSRIATLGSAAR